MRKPDPILISKIFLGLLRDKDLGGVGYFSKGMAGKTGNTKENVIAWDGVFNRFMERNYIAKKYPIEYCIVLKTEMPPYTDISRLYGEIKKMGKTAEELIHPAFPELVRQFKGDWTFSLTPISRNLSWGPVNTTLYFSELDDALLAKMTLL